MSEQAKKPFDITKYIGDVAALKEQHTVEAKRQAHKGFEGAGLDHLAFRCPGCNVPSAISGPGKFLCPHCGTASLVREKTEVPA